LLKDFLAAAAAGKNAVTGMKDTLDMVNTSRVKTLIFLSGLQVSGQKCSSCGLLTTLALERCPNCNHRLEQTPDVVDLAVHEVLRKGGSVEAINTSPELEKPDPLALSCAIKTVRGCPKSIGIASKV